MKGFIAGVVAGITIAATATAVAATSRTVYLLGGDTAAAGETACKVRAAGFQCRVGGDYRARYGVIVNSSQVAITEYAGFEKYRVVVRKRQSPVAP